MTSCSSPSSWAFLASVCDRSANSSCSTLETPNAAARRSALWPIVSAVENSATAGSYYSTTDNLRVKYYMVWTEVSNSEIKLKLKVVKLYIPPGRGVQAGWCQSDWASGRVSLPCLGTTWFSSSYGCDEWERLTWIPLRLLQQHHTARQQSDQHLERWIKKMKIKD